MPWVIGHPNYIIISTGSVWIKSGSVNKRRKNLILQSLLQHVLFLPGEVEQHRHSPDQLEGLREEHKQVLSRSCSHTLLLKKAALRTYLCLSGGHELKDNMFEVLKVDLSWVVLVHRAAHHHGGGWRTGCWWGVRTDLLLLVHSTLWKPLLHFRVWVRFQLLENQQQEPGWIQSSGFPGGLERVQATEVGSAEPDSPAPSAASSLAQPASAAAAWWSERHVGGEGCVGLSETFYSGSISVNRMLTLFLSPSCCSRSLLTFWRWSRSSTVTLPFSASTHTSGLWSCSVRVSTSTSR